MRIFLCLPLSPPPVLIRPQHVPLPYCKAFPVNALHLTDNISNKIIPQTTVKISGCCAERNGKWFPTSARVSSSPATYFICSSAIHTTQPQLTSASAL